MKCPKISNILFYGTDTLSTAVLSTLNQRGHNILSVTKSTTTPVYKYCKKHNLPVDIFTKSSLPFGRTVQCFREHMGVVTSFGGLIPGRVVRSTKLGFVNVHPSLIPKYRGAAPLQHTLLNGDKDTGITILEVQPRTFDKGRILHQVPIQLPLHLTGTQVWSFVAGKMSEVMAEYLDNFGLLKSRPQDTSRATHAPKILLHQLKALSHVCPQTQSAAQIYNISRLVNLTRLGISVSWNNRKLKLRSVHLVQDSVIVELARSRLRPGQFIYHDGLIMLRCVDGTALGISQMVLPFSHVMTAEQFYRNHAAQTKQVFTMFYISEEDVEGSGALKARGSGGDVVKARTITI